MSKKVVDLENLIFFKQGVDSEISSVVESIEDYIENSIPDSLPVNGGNADTVNGHSVNADVPEDAKFTDTVYTHPTTSGNKHIPSGGSSGQFLKWSADGTAVWAADNNTTYSNFVKSGSGAKAGLVPAPSTTAGTTKYLREDGTWQVPPDNNTTYSAATTSAAGLMSAADKTKLNNTISVKAIVQGVASSLTISSGTASIPYQTGSSKALVEVWITYSTSNPVTFIYGSRFLTGLTSTSTITATSAITSSAVSITIGTSNGAITLKGSHAASANLNYRVIWFI